MPVKSMLRNITSFWPYYRRFIPYCRPDIKIILGCCAFVVGVAATNTLMIWQISAPLNALQTGDFAAIPRIAAVLAIIVVVNQACHFSGNVLAAKAELAFIGRIRRSMLERCMAVSFPVVDFLAKGDILSRLSNDLDRVYTLVLHTLFWTVSHVCIFLFYTAMLFFISPRLAGLALLFSPLFLVHQQLFSKRKQLIAQNFFTSYGKLLSFESQTLGQLRGISSFNIEDRVSQRHRETFETARHWAFRNKRLDYAFNATMMGLIYLGALACVLMGLREINAHRNTAGELVSFLFYLGYLSVPVRGFTQLILQCMENSAAARRVAEILDLQPNLAERVDPVMLQNLSGSISFRQVSFAYPDGKQILDHVSFNIPAGATVALAGPSGCGKSTIAKLLLRFYDPSGGDIHIDGVDIRDVTLGSLRENIAMVWQEPFLINASVRDNLLLAKPNAREDEIIAACQASSSLPFIQQLPKGLDTIIGGDGSDLSAGQRQRLSIAQAFLRNAPILIMDEASSALDSQTEQEISASVARLRKGRTTLIIAHRYSAIRDVDHLIFFNGDGTIAWGTHEQLWATHPGYRHAVEWQTHGAEKPL